MRRILAGIMVIAAVLLVRAQTGQPWQLPPGEPKLKEGPGVEFVTANCMVCHSVDYISTQPRLNRAAWTAAVVKMREKYGAPLPSDKVELVVDYLTKNYGK